MAKEITCSRCGHKWTPRTICPAACPKCKSYYYMKGEPTKKMIQKAKDIIK